MKICHTWIQKYVNLDCPSEKIYHALTERGLEVENIEIIDIDLVCTAKIVSKKPHPNANKLSICEVDNGKEVLPVVCGAPNVEVNQIVFFAQIGAVLPGDFKIKKGKIRGAISLGMICAEDELGLGTNHDGILILNPSTPIGKPLKQFMSPVYELNITPNRPDALSHIGCARELASYFNKTLTIPKAKKPIKTTSNSKYVVSVEDNQACPLYISYVIENVTVEPSPKWLEKSLKNIGIQSINNIVDLTNYVLMEFGQPSHAFDLEKIKDHKLVLRYAKENEVLETLDNTKRTLNTQDFVIADSQNPLCLAGVMGGEQSKITEKTTKIILEVAYFNPIMIRKQVKRHQLSTDSSFRFERGTDPLSVELIGDYLAEIIEEISGGKVKNKLLQQSPKHPTKNNCITLRKNRIIKILGLDIPWKQINSLLQSVGIQPSSTEISQTSSQEICIIPSFRVDIEREIDLIEDIARLYGYNNIPTHFPQLPHKTTQPLFINQLSKQVRNFLSHSGLNECLNLRFVPKKHQELLYPNLETPKTEKVVVIKNPLNQQEDALPTTLIYNLLKSAQRNFNTQMSYCRFFEIGKIFFQEEHIDTKVREKNHLAILLSGLWKDAKWLESNQESNFYILKGLVENLFFDLRKTIQFKPSKNPLLHPKESLDILLDHQIIGFIGTLHLQTQKNFSLKKNIWICEIDLDLLKEEKVPPKKFQSISSYTSISREMNILTSQEISHGQIIEWIGKIKTPYLTRVYLNSVYQGDKLPKGKKTLHYSFIYQSSAKTLTDKIINKYQEKLAKQLEQQPEITFK